MTRSAERARSRPRILDRELSAECELSRPNPLRNRRDAHKSLILDHAQTVHQLLLGEPMSPWKSGLRVVQHGSDG